ncbi:MAG: hypothetical protein ABH842_05005 [Candidatus Micrarchaeota archaeon]
MGVTSFDETQDRKKLAKIEADYRLKCDSCGQEIVLIKFGENEFTIYSPLRSITINEVDIVEVKKWIEEKNYLKIHKLIREKWIQKMGLDYYCPECNKLYCEKEASIDINYDEGFYDDTSMTCPNGHQRCMDD